MAIGRTPKEAGQPAGQQSAIKEPHSTDDEAMTTAKPLSSRSSTQSAEEAEREALRKRMQELGRSGGIKSGAARRAKGNGMAAGSEGSSEIHLDQYSERERIIAALRRKAEAGDVAAAREYRNWLDRGNEAGDELRLDQLDREKRQLLRRWLEEGLAEHGGAASDGDRHAG